MSEDFRVEIVNPEKSFFSKDDVTEVVVPGYEGEMGILKDHISIISFLKPGIIKVISKGNEEKFYVDDGIVEFKNNSLSILTSSIFSLNKLDRDYINKAIENSEKELSDEKIDDQKRFLISQKIDVLKNGYVQTFINDLRDILKYDKSSNYISSSLVATESKIDLAESGFIFFLDFLSLNKASSGANILGGFAISWPGRSETKPSIQ